MEGYGRYDGKAVTEKLRLGHFIVDQIISDALKSDLAPVTVRQLLSRDITAEATILAGESGLENIVEEVYILSALSSRSELTKLDRTALILDATHFKGDSYQLDILVRQAYELGATALLLLNFKFAAGPTANRLANKLEIPLVSISGVESLKLADDFRRIIRLPFIARSDAVLRVADKFRHLPKNGIIENALKVLAEVLGGQVALLRPDRSILEQSDKQIFRIPESLELIEVSLNKNENNQTYLVQPLSLAPRETPSFWLAIVLQAPSSGWVRVSNEVLGFASWYFSSVLIADRLVQERDARFRLGVLNAISAAKEHLDPALLNQLGILGWRVNGWCTAIYVQLVGDVDPLRVLNGTPEIQQAFSSFGFVGPLIERPDGWSGWMMEKVEPNSQKNVKLASDFRQAVATLSLNSSRIRIYVGIGRPHVGILGLQESFAEAKDACTIAQSGGKNWDVQHIDEMGVRRILLGWYASESFAEFAATLLATVSAADSNGELLTTLETYLDCNCSPSDTAVALNIHRNTVINRIERLRGLLKIDLKEPDERLALQLACRVVKRKSD